MKIFKYLFIILLVSILSVFLYMNFIVYQIPYNPFREFSEENLEVVYFYDYDFTDEAELEEYGSSKDREKNRELLQYFKDLKLRPRNPNRLKREGVDPIVISGGFEFGKKDYEHIFINDLYLKDPRIFHISFKNDEFRKKSGYYEVIDGKVDYKYIKEFINSQKE